MNERLKELALQAGAQPKNLPPAVTLNWEQFAELIVRECINIVDDEGCGEGGSIRAMEKIAKHFYGVKL
jgi:hypothetical protein